MQHGNREMKTGAKQIVSGVEPLPQYREILLAVDSSDHSNRGVEDGIELAKLSAARITAAHVYAAQMHDLRFRQMEGGLPEQFRAEQELERQRDVHDDLITRGLSIISDSYLDHSERICNNAGLRFARRALEGKNYRQMVAETNSGDYDLLVLGALGLGAVAESRIGTVCERVVRRARIDTLVIKSPTQAINEGPIVVAIDGSAQAYGGLLTGLALARQWGLALHVVSAFDPYYHYVAFNRIAGVLSEEASKVFRFQEQERLHEEIIDSGLAKIYAGHLQIATDIAADYEVPIETSLLDGKPHEAIVRYLRELNPSLLIIGKLGIHADDELDIGGNAENLLRNASCAVLLSQREFQPQMERIADVTVSWTHEAQERLQRAPSFVQNMARMAILRYAQERGHTVITASIVEQATATLMPGRAEQVMAEIVEAHDAQALKREDPADAMSWSDEALSRLKQISDGSLQDNIRLRAEKKARSEKTEMVSLAQLNSFLDSDPETSVTQQSKCPFAQNATPATIDHAVESTLLWTAEASARLQQVPRGYCRSLTQQAVETLASQSDLLQVDLDYLEEVLKVFKAGSESVDTSIPWTDNARARIQRAPDSVRGMLVKEIETWAQREGLEEVDERAVRTIKREWQSRGVFHLEPGDPRGDR